MASAGIEILRGDIEPDLRWIQLKDMLSLQL
jgi:hypothetical protein